MLSRIQQDVVFFWELRLYDRNLLCLDDLLVFSTPPAVLSTSPGSDITVIYT